MILIEISYGELFDKISILQIKKKKIVNANDLKKVHYELFLLNNSLKESNVEYDIVAKLVNELQEVYPQL